MNLYLKLKIIRKFFKILSYMHVYYLLNNFNLKMNLYLNLKIIRKFIEILSYIQIVEHMLYILTKKLMYIKIIYIEEIIYILNYIHRNLKLYINIYRKSLHRQCSLSKIIIVTINTFLLKQFWNISIKSHLLCIF